MHRKTILPLLSSLWLGVATRSQELVPFALPWDDGTPGLTGLATDIEKPAGKRGPVRVRDGHLFTGEQRLRLFGANFTAGACFPDHDTAEKIAARMAKFGLNAARFHFLDSTWGKPRLIRYDTKDWSQWDADALDRLDYFIARLKEHGIYSNLNLLVGRRFGESDGVDPAIQKMDWKAAHAVGFFHAPHLEAQKAYARKLLTHRNPHTGLTYAEDPAVAVVEVNNENGLLHTWLAGDLDDLPAVFARDLQGQWNAWLARRYGGTPALAAAWGASDAPSGAEMLSNTAFAEGLRGWNLERHQGAEVDATADNGAAVLRVRREGSAGWHVQFNQPGLAVRKDAVYTVRFRARSDRERKIRVNVMQAHEPWKELGLETSVTLTPDEQAFAFTFIARADDPNARFGFSDLGHAGAEFRFSNFSVRPGGRVGLEEGESLEARNLAVPRPVGGRALTAGGRRDWIQFLWDTEQAHWTEMRRFLKQDLGVKAPLAGTIVATSTPNLMAGFDIVDTHAYWQHPRFPGKPWDRSNWTVQNLSMVTAADGGTLARLAFQRVAGKPHMVSEYNHPAPNTHAGEGPLFIAAWGARQDWDAIFLYTYSHDDAKTKAGRIPDFFDVGPHPTIMANAAVASLLFRRGDLSPASGVEEALLTPGREVELIARGGRSWEVLPADLLGINRLSAVDHRVHLRLEAAATPPASGPAPAVPPALEESGLEWQTTPDGRGLFQFRGGRSAGFIGWTEGRPVNLGRGVQVVVGKTRTGWCTFAMTLLEGSLPPRGPGRALLVATGYVENTGMGWKSEAKNTVGTDWGTAPSLVEVIPASLTLPRAGAPPMLYPLDELGRRGKGIPATPAGVNAASVQIGPPHKTLWYELAW